MTMQLDDALADLLREGRRLTERDSASPTKPTAPPERRRSSIEPPGNSRYTRLDDRFELDDYTEYGGHRRAQPTSRLQRTWIDPSEKPFAPVARPGNALVSRVMSLAASACIMALLAWIILPQVHFRLTTINTVLLRDGVLSAQAVQVAPTRPAVIKELFVDASVLPDSDLPAGTPIARVEGYSRDGLSNESTILSVPFDARFASVDQLEGGVAYPGNPVATVYDPRRMYVIVTVQPATLILLRRGMRATLISDVLSKPIAGTVISAVPLLGTDHSPTTAKLVNIRIKPDEERMSELVPGVRFDARIDLKSVPKDAPKLVFTVEAPKGQTNLRTGTGFTGAVTSVAPSSPVSTSQPR